MKKDRLRSLLAILFLTFIFGKAQAAVTITATGNATGMSATSSVYYGQAGIGLYGFTLTPVGGSVTLSTITLTASQTIANYFGQTTFRLLRSSNGNFSTGTNTPITSASFSSNTTTLTISITAETISVATTYFIVADYSAYGPVSTNFQFTNLAVTSSASNSISLPYNGPTVTFTAPTVTISGNNSTSSNGISPSNIRYLQNGIVVFGFTVKVTGNRAIINKVTLNSSQGQSPNDFSQYFSTAGFSLVENTSGTNYSAGTNNPVTAVFSGSGTSLVITLTGGVDLTPTSSTAAVTKNYFVVANYNVDGALLTNTQTFSLNNNGSVNYNTSTSVTSTTTVSSPANTNIAGATFNMIQPNITFAGQNVIGTGSGQNGISPTTITYNQTGIVMYGFSLTNTGSQTAVKQINLNTTSNPIAQFFSNFKVYRSTTSTFTSALAVPANLVATISPDAGNSAFTISGINETIAYNQTLYYFILADWTSTQGNNLPTTMQFTYSSFAVTAAHATLNNTSTTSGQVFPLPVPVVTISNYSTGIYTGTVVGPGQTYNLIGFNLAFSAPTNLGQMDIDINYFSGSYKFTDFVTQGGGGVQVIDAATGTTPSYISSINVNGDNIKINFNSAPMSTSVNLYLKVKFCDANTFATHFPGTFALCIGPTSNTAGVLCINKSNCTIQNNYNVTATGTTCSQTFSGGNIYDWIGASNTNWNNTSNWLKDGNSTTTTPSVSTDYVRIGYIKYTGANSPVNNTGAAISIGNVEVGPLGSTSTSNAAAVLDLNGKDLSVTKALTVNANAVFTLKNGSSTTANFNSTNTATSTVASTGVIAFTGTNAVKLVNSGSFTLLSDASGTGAFGPLPSSSFVISGNYNVQRYMSGGTGRRGYRLLSSPVNTSTLNGTAVPAYSIKSLQASTPITGWNNIGTYTLAQPSNGFDLSATGNPSVFFYYEPDPDPTNTAIVRSDYKALSTINDLLPVGNGFLYFFRGNRNVLGSNGISKILTTCVAENTTMTYTGTINQGDIQVNIPTAPLSLLSGATSTYVYSQSTGTTGNSPTFSYTDKGLATDGLHLVGNPYPNTIDLETLNSSLFTNPGSINIYMINNNGTLGVYQLGSGSTTLNNGVGRYVSSGQGFFIKASSAGTTLKFTEACKVTSSAFTAPTAFNAIADAENPQVLRINLVLDSVNSNETMIQFGRVGAHNLFSDKEDAGYRSGLSQTTYMASYSSDNKACLINQMGALDSIKKIGLYVGGSTSGTYTLNFKGAQSMDLRYKLYLVDNLLKDSIDLSAKSVYTFNIDRANAATYGAARFNLSVHPTHIADKYKLVSFTGEKDNGNVLLKWETKYEGDYTGFAVLRSTDGWKTHSKVFGVQSNGQGLYSYTDTKPVDGVVNEYKLVQNNINNVNLFSDIVKVSFVPDITVISKVEVRPNPVVNSLQISLKEGTAKGTLTLKIYNIRGDLVINNAFSTSDTISQDVSRLMQGNYVIHLSDKSKNYGSATFTKL